MVKKERKEERKLFLTTSLRAKITESMKYERNMRLERWLEDTEGKTRVNGVLHHKSLMDWPEEINSS